MKKTLLSVATICALLLTGLAYQSCTKAIKDAAKGALGAIDINADPIAFVIPVVPGTHTGFVSLDSMKLSLNVDSILKASSGGVTGIDDADQISITSMSMQLTDADSANNWANFDTVHVLITSNTAPTPTTLCTLQNTDRYSDLASGDINATLNLKDYLKGNTIFDILYGTNRRATTHELHGLLTVVYHVK